MIVLALSVLTLLLQFGAVGLALRLARTTGKRLAWTLLATAVLLMALRRALTIWGVIQHDDPAPALATAIGTLSIAVLMVLGIRTLQPLLETVDRVEELEIRIGRGFDNSLSEFYIFSGFDLLFLTVNHGARRNLGYSAAELATMTPIDLKPEFNEASFRALLEPLVNDEVPRLSFSTTHRRKDGSTYPVDVDLQKTPFGGQTAFLAAILDSSERVRAERKLRDSEEHFRNLIEHSQDVTTILDPEGTVLWQSLSMQPLLGHDPADRVGRSVADLMHPEDLPGVLQAMARAKEHPEEIQAVMYRLRHADGSWRTMEALGRVREQSDGTRQYVINQRDVTDRVVAIREKAAIESQLRHVQRMETIWTLAGGIAHDFNNLLTPIIGYAHLLEERDADAEEPKEILRAAMRAQRLVKQMLTLSRQTEVELLPLELQETVAEAMQLVRSALPADIAVESHLEAPGMGVLADSTQIHQVVMNLCTNAAQAMETSGGRLTVRLTPTAAVPENDIMPAASGPAPFLLLSVSDTGPGLDTTVQTRIFDPFFTTREKGVGLGLSIVHGIVLSHGGAVRLHSVAGEGSRFDVYLPMLSEYEPRDTPDGPAVRGSETEHVLVVDDEVAVAQVTGRLLRAQGYRSSVVPGPQEALAFLEAHSVSLVLTDQTMPGMSGLELATRIRQKHPQLPVILMSGYSHDATAEKRLSAGIDASLTKPFTAPELAECVRAVFDARETVTTGAGDES